MARNNRVSSRHEFAPLVSDRMEIGVADSAEEDFNLHIVFAWISPGDCRTGERRFCAGSRVSSRFVHGLCSFVLFVADLFHPVDRAVRLRATEYGRCESKEGGFGVVCV